MTMERTTSRDETCDPSSATLPEPSAEAADATQSTTPAAAAPTPQSAGFRASLRAAGTARQALRDVPYPVLPLPKLDTTTKPRDVVVFPGTTKLLEFTAKQINPARAVLQHLVDNSESLVVLMDENEIDPPPPTTASAMGMGMPTFRHAVLAKVLDVEVLETRDDGSTNPWCPMQPEQDQDRWLALGSATMHESHAPTVAESTENVHLCNRVQAMRVLVQGIGRVRYAPGTDFSQPIASADLDDDWEANDPLAFESDADLEFPPDHLLTLVRARPILLTSGVERMGNIGAGIESLATTLGANPQQRRQANATGAEQLAHLTELLTICFNDLAVRDGYWRDHLTPLGLGHSAAAEAATQLENMADQLLFASTAERCRWIQLEDVRMRVQELLQLIQNCRDETAETHDEYVAQEATRSHAEKLAQRKRCWTPEWRQRAESDSWKDMTDTHGKVFTRQKYYVELPQRSDMREPKALDRSTLVDEFDRHVYGMRAAKMKVIDHLLQQLHAPSEPMRTLCLVGPPGVGKTHFARTVADVVGRGFAEIPVGGATTAIDLEGANSTWARPRVGTILQALHEIGEPNPVLMLDEIDKVNEEAERCGGGNPASCLLNFLDPSKVHSFADALLELPYDLSKVLFIATANVPGEIPEPVRDRLTFVRIPGYTEAEKLAIARQHMIPNLQTAFGLRDGDVTIPDDVLRHLIHTFCPSKGVRELREHLQRLFVLAIERGRKHPGQALRQPVCLRTTDVDQLLNTIGKEVFWSQTWTDTLHRLKKTDEEKRRYLENLPQPCDTVVPATIDLTAARAALHESHLGLNEVKELVIDYLGVARRTPHMRAKPICLLGPPGIGKTSLCRSIATATHRKFQSISVGGSRSECLLRGSNYAPGQILRAMMEAQTFNPVILLDEIDKISAAGDGGNSAALLEILDPEQNTRFLDHFLNLPYSLAGVLFIATANYHDRLPRELLDRFHVIHIPDYSRSEKRAIVHQRLIGRVLVDNGFTEQQVIFDEATVEMILQRHAEDPGLRSLEDDLTTLANRFGQPIASNHTDQMIRVEPEAARDVLEQSERHDRPLGFDIATNTKAVAGTGGGGCA